MFGIVTGPIGSEHARSPIEKVRLRDYRVEAINLLGILAQLESGR